MIRLIHGLFFAFFLLAFSACSNITTDVRVAKPIAIESKINGDKKEFLSDEISSWAILSTDNSVRLVGLTVPLKLFENQKVFDSSSQIASLDFPDTVKESTFINHADIQINEALAGNFPAGSLSLRFYSIDRMTQLSIKCEGNQVIAPESIPSGYNQSMMDCYPGIGMRFTAELNQQDGDHPTLFARINFGFSNGEIVFVEPVISVQKFLNRESFTLYIAPPAKYTDHRLFPGTVTGIYNSKTDSYDISVWSFADLNEALEE